MWFSISHTMNALLAVLFLWASASEFQFDRSDARTLVRSAPGAVDLPERCIGITENNWLVEGIVMFSVVDKCRKNSVTDLVATYFVDLRTGDVYIADPANPPEQSQRLKQTRERLLRKKAPTKPSVKAK